MTCDRVTIINRGKVIATDTPDNLMSHLTASGGYELEVDGEITSLESRLKEMPGIVKVDINSDVNFNKTNHHFIRLITESDKELGKEISALIISQGCGLYEMRRNRPTLEDVFLELLTEESTVESPEEVTKNTATENLS